MKKRCRRDLPRGSFFKLDVLHSRECGTFVCIHVNVVFLQCIIENENIGS